MKETRLFRSVLVLGFIQTTILGAFLFVNGCAYTKPHPDDATKTRLTLVCNSDFEDRCWRDFNRLCTEGYEITSEEPLTARCK